MKTKKIMIIAVLVFVSGSIFAQGQMKRKGQVGGRMMNIPDLTDVQKTQIKDMRTANMKVMLPLKNELREKQAHLNTISTGDNVKITDVNIAIEEISAIKLTMAKKRAQHRQDIRKILSDDQRVFFDMQSGKQKRRQNAKKQGNRQGKCIK